MPTTTPNLQQLQRALAIAEQIQQLEEELKTVLDGSGSTTGAGQDAGLGESSKRRPGRPRKSTSAPAVSPAKPVKRGRKPFSAETIAKMAASQKVRWAAENGSVVSPANTLNDATKPKRKKGKLSPEGRARIVAALKARHAAKKRGA